MEVAGYKLGRQNESEQYYQTYSALDLNNQKSVNIQFFNSELVANRDFLDQFQKITSVLTGRNVGVMTPIVQAEASSRSCYVITEHNFCPRSIFSTKQNMTRQEVIHYALQIAQTLDELHKLNIVHGGVELRSLCFRSKGNLTLKPPVLQNVIDILRPITFKTLTKEQRQYLAPDAGKGLTPATDFYALGIVIFQLLFGIRSIAENVSDSLKEHVLNSEHRDLIFFLRKLLTVDVDRRIQNLDQFKAALQQCSVDFSKTVTANDNRSIIQSRDTTEKVKIAPGSNLRWVAPAIVVAVIALAGIIYTFYPQQGLQLLSGSFYSKIIEIWKSNGNAGENRKIISRQKPKTEVKSQPDQELEHPVNGVGFDKLYRQALDQVENNPKIALMIINIALKHRPGSAEAIGLKKTILQHIEAASILDRAESQLAEGQLTEPKGDNAYESYQTLAKVLSSDDERVESGLSKIAAAYHTLSEGELKNNRLKKAMEYADLGLSVRSDYARLHVLRGSIVEQQKKSQREALTDDRYREQLQRNQKYTDALIHAQLRGINKTERTEKKKVE